MLIYSIYLQSLKCVEYKENFSGHRLRSFFAWIYRFCSRNRL